MVRNFDSLISLMDAFKEPQSAIDHFTAMRWKNGRFCPYCKHTKIYNLKNNFYKCASIDCFQKFSITVGTVFENTKLPLRIWFGAIWLITNHKNGIASTTLARDLHITQKSAWFVLHRLRHAATTESFNAPLSGVVEIYETYVGGSKKKGKRGKHKGKTPMIGLTYRKLIA